MDISNNINTEVKNRARNLTIECQVLENLLRERKAVLQNLLSEVIKANTDNPHLYGLRFSGDVWELVLRPEALVKPETKEIKNAVAS